MYGINQGSGRKTRGSTNRSLNNQATALWIANYRRQKAENRRRYVCTDIHTGKTKTVTKQAFNEMLNLHIENSGFDWSFAVRDRLFQGQFVEIGDCGFQIEAADTVNS